MQKFSYFAGCGRRSAAQPAILIALVCSKVLEKLGVWLYATTANVVGDKERHVMLNCQKMALILSMLCLTAATTMTLAKAQETTESERFGLATCLVKCPDGDKACNNRCISQSQTNGRVWSDGVRACIRGCRVAAQTPVDGVFSCITGCRP
jgi:hypothetical protein